MPNLNLTLIACLVLMLTGCLGKSKTFSDVFKGQISHPRLAGFTQTSIESAAGTSRYEFKSADAELFVAVTGADKTAGLKSIADKEMLIESMYKDYPSPYPGTITAAVRCAPDLKPKKYIHSDETTQILVFELFTNDRKIFGSCVDEQLKYRSLYALVYCPARGKMYDIKLHIPRLVAPPFGDAFASGFKCH